MTTPLDDLPLDDLTRSLRPGFVIFDVLSEVTTLRDYQGQGEFRVITRKASGGVAGISDIHRTYRINFRGEMDLRLHADRRQPMTYESFGKLFRKARAIGLVELVRLDPIPSDSPAAQLSTIRDGEVVQSMKNIFQLTRAGREAGDAVWGNLNKAYLEGLSGPEGVGPINAALDDTETILQKWRDRGNRNSVALTIELEGIANQLEGVIDLDEALSTLSDYQGLERDEFDTQEEYSAERGDLWDATLDQFEEAIENARADL